MDVLLPKACCTHKNNTFQSIREEESTSIPVNRACLTSQDKYACSTPKTHSCFTCSVSYLPHALKVIIANSKYTKYCYSELESECESDFLLFQTIRIEIVYPFYSVFDRSLLRN